MSSEGKKARVITASRELQSRIGTGTINSDSVEKAQSVIESNAVDFEPMAKLELANLAELVRKVKTDELSGKEALDAFMLPIMNLKANAATFDFPIISSLAGTVLTLLEEMDGVNKDILTITDNLNKAITVALAMDMRGEPGEQGKILVTEFKQVCKAYLEKNR